MNAINLKKFIAVLLLLSFGTYANHAKADSVDVYLRQEKTIKALQFAIRQSDAQLRKKDYRGYCQNSLKRSKIYVGLHDLKKSTSVLFNALKIAEKHNLEYEQVLLLKDIGRNFMAGLNKQKSLEYYRKGGKVAERMNNDTLKAFIYQNIFKILIETEQNDSAYHYASKIRNLIKNSTNYEQIYKSYSNFSVYYFTLRRFDIGKKYLDTATYYAEKINKINYLKTCYINLGYYYLNATKDYKSGEKQYFKILNLNPSDTLSEDVTNCYLNLSYVYEQMGDYKKANHYLNKYVDNTAVLFENKINSQLKDAETKYQIDKVETGYKKKQFELEELQSKRQKIFIIIIALLVIVSILIYFFNQTIRLKQKNKLKDLESQARENLLNATLDGQENERKKIASVLHDSISAQLSSAGLHLSAIAAQNHEKSEEIAKTRAILKEAHDKVRDLSHELLPTLLAKFGLLYALRDLCEKNSNRLIEFEYQSNIGDRKRYNEEFEMKLYFITAELMNNVLKHSGASQALLTVNEQLDSLEISLADNGHGFDAKTASNEGFGLTQIRARINNMQGKFSVDSQPGEGTTVQISVPTLT